MSMSFVRRPQFFVPALLVALVVLAVGLWAFQPWKIWTKSYGDESLPVGTGASAPAQPGGAPAQAGQTRTLASGPFKSYEHTTTGTAKIVEIAGKPYLRLENFDTSDGPDVRVYLSQKRYDIGSDKYGREFEGSAPEFIELGKLKFTTGNQNYEIPAGINPADYQSAVIWCDRFNVAFGAAPIKS
jgi:hypothetical protein